jgi:hypothetical protein
MGNLTLTAILATPLGGDPNPDVGADGEIRIPKTTWGPSTYQVPAGMYTVWANPISGRFTSQGRSYTAQYTPSISQASTFVPPGGTGGSAVTYTVVNGTFCDYEGCRSVVPGVYSGSVPMGEPDRRYEKTDMGEYYYIVDDKYIYRTHVHYFDSPYAVSSGETVNASYASEYGLSYHHHVVKKQDKRTGATITDIPHPSPHALGFWDGNPTRPPGLRPGPPGPGG